MARSRDGNAILSAQVCNTGRRGDRIVFLKGSGYNRLNRPAAMILSEEEDNNK